MVPKQHVFRRWWNWKGLCIPSSDHSKASYFWVRTSGQPVYGGICTSHRDAYYYIWPLADLVMFGSLATRCVCWPTSIISWSPPWLSNGRGAGFFQPLWLLHSRTWYIYLSTSFYLTRSPLTTALKPNVSGPCTIVSVLITVMNFELTCLNSFMDAAASAQRRASEVYFKCSFNISITGQSFS